MIYCIWYPSGGFGHFINAIITLHGNNFVRPSADKVLFNDVGDGHSLDLTAPKYKDNKNYDYNFLSNVNYSVLIDNGINNETSQFVNVFSKPSIIKLCYSDISWPVVAKTLIIKAMKSSLESELSIDPWNSNEDWCKREKYFLFLRDHTLRHCWKNSIIATNIFVEDLENYNLLKSKIESAGIILTDFKDLWNDWDDANASYFLPIGVAKKIINSVKNKQSLDLSDITDVWTQAVVYYFIWLEFKKEVPHNEFNNFFTNTDQITNWIARDIL